MVFNGYKTPNHGFSYELETILIVFVTNVDLRIHTIHAIQSHLDYINHAGCSVRYIIIKLHRGIV